MRRGKLVTVGCVIKNPTLQKEVRARVPARTLFVEQEAWLEEALRAHFAMLRLLRPRFTAKEWAAVADVVLPEAPHEAALEVIAAHRRDPTDRAYGALHRELKRRGPACLPSVADGVLQMSRTSHPERVVAALVLEGDLWA